MSENYIPINECVDRGAYEMRSRNLHIGVFSIKDGGFIGIREKFRSLYLFTEYHYDNGPPFGTVRPTKKIGDLPADIENEENMRHEHGDSWVKEKSNGKIRAVARRNLRENEEIHGRRQGFVDEYVDTGKRLSDDIYPHLRENKKLFDYLKKLKNNDKE